LGPLFTLAPCFPVSQTSSNHLLFYGIHVTKEAIWRCPDGHEPRRVSIYLQNSLHVGFDGEGEGGTSGDAEDEDGEAALVADIAGDSKTLLVAMSDGTLCSYSWQGSVSLFFLCPSI
jgi:hypothetical protein